MNDGHFETIIFAYVAPIDYFRNRIDMPNAMKQHLYGLLLTTVLLTGCTHRNPIAETLTYAGEQLKTDPDDALHILRGIAPEALGSRAERARYALLYAEAAERSADTVDSARSDSLLRMAWDYYRERPQEVRNQCRTRYYQARNKMRQGDNPGALRLFLEVEEQLRHIDEPRYLGLLYLRIGKVYHDELNFTRAYRYYREARDLFLRLEETEHTTEALLGMTASALRMHDLVRAHCDCTMALDLADESHNEKLVRKSLGYFATIYAVTDTARIPEGLLQRIEQSVRADTTASGLCTKAQTQLLRGQPQLACRSIRTAELRTPRPGELPMLYYTAYLANMAAGEYREATRQINRFILLNDSLTRTSLQNSAGMIEREFFRERTDFYDYRLQSRRRQELLLIGTGLLLLGIAGYLLRQRIRLHKIRNERYLLLVRELQSEYRRLSEDLQAQRHEESRLKGAIASRFDVVNQLGKALYERGETASGQTAMVRQVKKLIEGFAENGEMLQELEQIVNLAHDDVMRHLRTDFPAMKEADIRLLCYIFGGFSPQVISLFMEESVANIYARKSRLKARIRNSESPHRELFMALLG